MLKSRRKIERKTLHLVCTAGIKPHAQHPLTRLRASEAFKRSESRGPFGTAACQPNNTPLLIVPKTVLVTMVFLIQTHFVESQWVIWPGKVGGREKFTEGVHQKRVVKEEEHVWSFMVWLWSDWFPLPFSKLGHKGLLFFRWLRRTNRMRRSYSKSKRSCIFVDFVKVKPVNVGGGNLLCRKLWIFFSWSHETI